MAKKVVSKGMAKLLAQLSDLKVIIKETKKAAGLHDRSLTKLYRVEDKIAELENKEAEKAAAKAAKAA